MLTYEQACEFVEESKKRGSVLGLSNMQTLMEVLHHPQNTIPMVHIAGTNGKGSVGAYLASICKEAHMTVGRYCSPAVFSPLECWQYDGRNITEEEYANSMSQVKEACDIVMSQGIFPTAFEIETAMAFVYFAKKRPDVVFLETGMGGATDATNVVSHPLACVFTKISFDHMQFLGNTLAEIAEIKAGIMKPGAMIFWGKQDPEVERVLKRRYEEAKKAGEAQGKKTLCGKVHFERCRLDAIAPGELDFTYQDVNYRTRMAGIYQMENAMLAIAVFEGIWQRAEGVQKEGIWKAKWPGRFEVLSKNPLFLMDGAHNEDAARQLAKTMEKSFTNPSFVYIIGVLADKEHKKMLEILLPYAKQVYTITPQNSRALDGSILAEEVRMVAKELKMEQKAVNCQSIEEAKEQAEAFALQNNLPIMAFGSLSYLGDLKKCLTEKK